MQTCDERLCPVLTVGFLHPHVLLALVRSAQVMGVGSLRNTQSY